MAAGLAGWWLAFSTEARLRHLLIALGLVCFAVVFDLFLEKWSWRKLVLAVAFAAALLPRAEHLAWIAPPRPYFQPSPRVVAMLEARDYLEAHRDGRVIAADWWASGCDMEYLLEGSVNLVHYRALERLGPRRILFYENAKWIDWSHRGRERWQAALARYGATLAFEKDIYRIYVADPSQSEAPARPRPQ